ncbi:hypothetical protein TWF694_009295 [Orbilia ellipsospora]|uniref:F-box domain-containing protein n=1 Tax=Orbilia ellipsospora TaxID=2528407 RepID=A0AAV9XEH2_9PEZI
MEVCAWFIENMANIDIEVRKPSRSPDRPPKMNLSSFERLLGAVPAVEQIGRLLPVSDLLALNWTSHTTRAAFHPVYARRVDLRLKLSQTFKDPDAMIKCMRKQKAVIGGNRSISFIWDDIVDPKATEWQFYVLPDYKCVFEDHLVSVQGLVELPEAHQDSVRDTAFEWRKFQGDGADVIVNTLWSNSAYPITQIIGKYYLTILNCFSSVDCTFIGYPEFTLNRIIAERESSNKVEYKLNRARWFDEHHRGLVQSYLDLGFTKVDRFKLREAMHGPPNLELRNRGYRPIKNPSIDPIKIMHKLPKKRRRQLTEVDLGVIVKIRPEKYWYVDFLPKLWIPRSWTKMRPSDTIDRESYSSKAAGQSLDDWYDKREKARIAKAKFEAEYPKDSDSDEDAAKNLLASASPAANPFPW